MNGGRFVGSYIGLAERGRYCKDLNTILDLIQHYTRIADAADAIAPTNRSAAG